MEVTAEHRTVFAEEAREHLEEWEGALLNLEQNPGDTELINQMFRAIHTLKGSAGFIGLNNLQRVAHDLESALQDVRDGVVELVPELVDLLFQGLDICTRMAETFTAGEEFEDEFEEDLEGFLSRLWAQTGKEKPDETAETAHGNEGKEEQEFTDPGCSSAPLTEPIREPETSTGRRRYILRLWVKSSGREAFLRAFLVRNRLSGLATIVSEDPAPEILKDSGGRFTYTVILETNVDEECLREALNIDLLEITSLSELDGQESLKATAEDHPSKDAGATSSETTVRATKADEVVRVSVERLDTLLNLVGELVIQNSGFVSIAQELKGLYGKSNLIIDLEEKTEGLAKITRDLQDGIMKVRMLPVNNVFGRFYRVVRDLAKDRKKDITLDIFGEETEIDKKVMDRIGDPLVHLIRNAVDHGIESREARLQAGKAPVGLVRLGAYQDGDHICIEVFDDGRGLDRNALLRKAVEKGLASEEEAEKLSDEQVLSLIFLPGFSTAKEISEVSGRGVGMDVVKRAIEGMDGSIRIRSSVGRGTTVTIALPLTMAIIPAVLVEVSGSTLAIPLSSVKEVLQVTEEELKTIGMRRVVRLRDEVLAMVHLREALAYGSDGSCYDEAGRMPVVIVDYEEKKIGLGVDKVMGTGEIVIKSLSRHYREIEGLIGASILGNGRICLIVDVEALIRRYHHVDGDERSFTGSSIFSIQSQNGRPAPVASRQEPTLEAPPEVENAEESGKTVAAVPRSEEAEIPLQGSREEETQEPKAWEEDRMDALTAELKESKAALMEDIHNAGAIQASMALSQLTSREVRVSFPESQIVQLGGIAEFLLGGEEEPVGGLYVGIEGDLDGGILMVLPVQYILGFHDQLYQRPPGTCTSLEEVDMSGISELGNILSASFINAMSDGTKLNVKSEAPEISVDMCQPVIDSVLARFNQPGDWILLTKALIYCEESEEAVCHLLLFLEPESLQILIAALMDNFE